jgi:hypothetical protein
MKTLQLTLLIMGLVGLSTAAMDGTSSKRRNREDANTHPHITFQNANVALLTLEDDRAMKKPSYDFSSDDEDSLIGQLSSLILIDADTPKIFLSDNILKAALTVDANHLDELLRSTRDDELTAQEAEYKNREAERLYLTLNGVREATTEYDFAMTHLSHNNLLDATTHLIKALEIIDSPQVSIVQAAFRKKIRGELNQIILRLKNFQ